MDAALRFLGVLLGVGSIESGVGRWRCEVPSESLSTSANARLTGVLRGVLCRRGGRRGEAGDEGGDEMCVLAKRALLLVGGGVVAR
jgi:hypothetical protein